MKRHKGTVLIHKGTALIVVAAYLMSTSMSWAAEAEATAPAAAPAATDAAGAATAEAGQLLSAGELEQLVAPIALYPDDLLATVLMAATYPLEIVQADRWLRNNKTLKGEVLKTALDKQSWDDTVKSLVSTPQVLATMSEQVEWTQKLGDAVLAQQDDLMAAVQRLRLKAQQAGYLKSTKEQTVLVETVSAEAVPAESGGAVSSGGAAAAPSQVIVIESAQPSTVSVPYYDPGVVYGSWGYPSHPPYYWQPPYGYYGYYPGWYPGRALSAGVAFGLGVAWVGGVTGAFNWGNRSINIGQVNIGSGNVRNVTNVRNWQHNSAHRGGVRYNNSQVANRFSKTNAAGIANRGEFRGRESAGGGLGGAGGSALAGAAGGALAGAAGGALARRAGADAHKSKLGGGDLANKAGGGNLANKAGGGNRANKAGGGNLANKAGGGKVANRAGGGNARVKAGGGGAFNGVKQGGGKAKANSARGKASMGSYNKNRGGGARGGGGRRGGGGAMLPRGGGGRGGGRR